MSVIRWEEPPPDGNRGMKAPKRSKYWQDVAAQLRERPGRWALVLEGDFNAAGGIAGMIKAGRLAAFRPAGEFQALTRTVGSCSVYARYVGEGADR